MYRIIDIDEKLALFITIVVLSLVFGSRWLIAGKYFEYLMITIVATIGVIPHELAHRWSARRMNCYSRFVLDPLGLIITLITAIPFIPFKVIMPGYTVIVPYTYDPVYMRKINGLVSLFGPLTNIFAAAISLLIYAITYIYIYVDSVIHVFLLLCTWLNSWIALFNLLPIPPLDGSKVITWKPLIWVFSLILSIILWFVASSLLRII